MTDDEIDRLEALCEAATPGPWKVGPASIDVCERDVDTAGGDESVASYMRERDAEFIVAARTALPEALAEVRRLRDHVLMVEDACSMDEGMYALRLQERDEARAWAERIRANPNAALPGGPLRVMPWEKR